MLPSGGKPRIMAGYSQGVRSPGVVRGKESCEKCVLWGAECGLETPEATPVTVSAWPRGMTASRWFAAPDAFLISSPDVHRLGLRTGTSCAQLAEVIVPRSGARTYDSCWTALITSWGPLYWSPGILRSFSIMGAGTLFCCATRTRSCFEAGNWTFFNAFCTVSLIPWDVALEMSLSIHSSFEVTWVVSLGDRSLSDCSACRNHPTVIVAQRRRRASSIPPLA